MGLRPEFAVSPRSGPDPSKLSFQDECSTVLARRVSPSIFDKVLGESIEWIQIRGLVSQRDRILPGLSPYPASDRVVVQHQLAMLETLGREELQGLLFQHRTPVMVFPASEDDRHN